ncbi:hypothetical protein [Actinoplanes sp. NPDC049118]|uniref:hypothetical protein n=1 Tax=Actinoplanes sp. NPDC049118 TaxID=3155769 RepID=UPI0033C7DAEF
MPGNAVAFLAYGYDLPTGLDVDETRQLLLTAAEIDARTHEASAEGLLDDPEADAQYRLSVIGLHVEEWGDAYSENLFLAARVKIVEDDVLHPLEDDEWVTFPDERQRLEWAMKTLGAEADQPPRWQLGMRTFG